MAGIKLKLWNQLNIEPTKTEWFEVQSASSAVVSQSNNVEELNTSSTVESQIEDSNIKSEISVEDETEKEVKVKPLISLIKKIEDQKTPSTNNNDSTKWINSKKELQNNKKSELFKNYDSDFHKNEKTILQQIKSIRFMPKTRVWLVISLISVTIFTIISLFIFDPKHHSLENYKANIMYIVWQKSNNIDISKSNTNSKNSWIIIDNGINDTTQNSWTTFDKHTPIENVQNPWIITDNNVSNEPTSNSWVVIDISATPLDNWDLIKEKWITVKPDIIVLPNWDKVYSYKWNTYSKEWLQEIIKNEVQVEIDKKIKNHLSEIYLK